MPHPVAAAAPLPSTANVATATATSLPAAPEVECELEHAIAFSPVQGTLLYHPDGKHYLHTMGSAIVINTFHDPHEQSFLRGHDDSITCFNMSRSGRLLASGQKGLNSDVCVWSFDERRLLYRLSEHDHGVASVAFSEDERLLASAGFAEDKKLIIWDVGTGNIVTCVTLSPIPTSALTWAGFVKDIKRRDTNRYLLVAVGGHQIVHWSIDARTGDIQGDKVTADGRATMVRQLSCAVFTEDKEVMFAGTTTGDFVVVTSKDRKLRRTIGPACKLGVHSMLCGDGVVLIGGGDGTITKFDQEELVDRAHCLLKGAVVGMSYSQDRLEVLAGTDRGFLYRVRVDTLEPLMICENHSAPVTTIQYSKDVSDRFATASEDCTIRVWDASDYSVITSVHIRDAEKPLCLVYSLDLLISGWQDGQVRAFDADACRPLWAIPNAQKGGVTAIALSHNERFIITGGAEGDVRLWELRSRDLVSHLKGHSLPVTRIALYHDDLHAVSVSLDRSIICWDLRTEKRVSTHLQRMGGVNGVGLSSDETTVITVGQEKRVTFWDLREHNPVAHRALSNEGDDEAQGMALSPDGRWIATAGTGQLLKLWDYDNIRLQHKGMGHSKTITDVKFSPDGKQAVTVGNDGAILIWNIFTN